MVPGFVLSLADGPLLILLVLNVECQSVQSQIASGKHANTKAKLL